MLGCQPTDLADAFRMVVMIGPHDCDRMIDAPPTARAHRRKQDPFFLGHMRLHLACKRTRQADETVQLFGFVRIPLLNAFRQGNMGSKVCPVHLVITGHDMFDQLAHFMGCFNKVVSYDWESFHGLVYTKSYLVSKLPITGFYCALQMPFPETSHATYVFHRLWFAGIDAYGRGARPGDTF